MHVLKYAFAMSFTFLVLAIPASAQLGQPLASFKLKYGAPVEFKREPQLPPLKNGWEVLAFTKSGFEIRVLFVDKKAERALLLKTTKGKDGKPNPMTDGEIMMRLKELSAGKPWPTIQRLGLEVLYATKDTEFYAQYISEARMLQVERVKFTESLNNKDSALASSAFTAAAPAIAPGPAK